MKVELRAHVRTAPHSSALAGCWWLLAAPAAAAAAAAGSTICCFRQKPILKTYTSSKQNRFAMLNHKFVLLIFQQLVQRYSYNCNISKNVTLCSTRGCRIMPGAMPPRVTIMPNYAELCYYADYAAPMQLCRFIMLASSGMPNLWRYFVVY